MLEIDRTIKPGHKAEDKMTDTARPNCKVNNNNLCKSFMIKILTLKPFK